MPRSYVKKLKQWSNDDIKKAIDKVKCGKSLHKAASKCNMSQGKLHQAIKKYEKGIDLSCQSGKKTSLSSKNLNAFPQEETAPSEPALKKSFEGLALEKIKEPTYRAPAPRRMKVDLTAKVIMQKEYLEAIKRAEEKKKKTTKKTQLPKEVSDNE